MTSEVMMMVQHANERPWNSERKAPLDGRLHLGSRCDKWVVGESGGRREEKRERASLNGATFSSRFLTIWILGAPNWPPH